MNLRTSETEPQIPTVVQETTEPPVVSNYPRGGFVSPPQTFEQSVFRQSLTAIGKRPSIFIVFGIVSILIGATWMNFVPIVAKLTSSWSAQIGFALASFLVHSVGRVIQNHAANEIARLDGGREPTFAPLIKCPQAWGATLLLSLMIFIVGTLSSLAAAVLASVLNLAPYDIPTLLNLINTPIGVIVTCRFIFAPFIAANTGAGVIGSFRESVTMTQGVGLKAAGWTLLLYVSFMVANWLPRFNMPIFNYLGYLAPLFLYVTLGVWCFRRARLWHSDRV